MKLTGEYARKVYTEDGAVEVTFRLDGYMSKRDAQQLEKDKRYTLDIREQKNKRTLAQNALLWELIGEICITENGQRNADDEMNIYCMLLQMTGAKCDYFECTEEAYEAFREQFRVCTVVQERDHGGTKTVMVKAYLGSSKMDTKEMNELIDSALMYAESIGINTDYWSERFGERQ